MIDVSWARYQDQQGVALYRIAHGWWAFQAGPLLIEVDDQWPRPQTALAALLVVLPAPIAFALGVHPC